MMFWVGFIKLVMREQWSKQVLKGLKRRRVGTRGDEKKGKERKCSRPWAVGPTHAKREIFFKAGKDIGGRGKLKRSVLWCCKDIKLMQAPVTWPHTHACPRTQTYTQTQLKWFINIRIFSKTSSLRITEGNVYKAQQLRTGPVTHVSISVQCV